MTDAIVNSFYLRTGKSWLDAVAALAGLIVLSPLLLIAGIAVKATSRGSVFFGQERVGQYGRIFRIFKFRSMREPQGQEGALLTAAGDSRITPVGKLLRMTKIDELPQLINVLLGEMSLVGPRPEVPKYVSAYTNRQRSVLLFKPGVTGPTANRYIREEELLAQQPDREAFYVDLLLPDKLEMDLGYCERITFSHDLKLLFTTFVNIFVAIAQLDKPLPGASRLTLAQTLAKCRCAPVTARIIPSLQELLTGQVQISQLRETRVEEVLGRESVEVPEFEEMTRGTYAGKRVLVTGAGGSIGSELVRQLARLSPAEIAVLDKDENSVYELEQELSRKKLSVSIEPQIADIRDASRLRAIFSDFRPQIIFHAAAHKHVPLMEMHPCEAILNNVGGTKNILEMASEFRAEKVVFISSDKAVNPANVMGATKRIGEMLVQSAANSSVSRFACVRFGNVLGSRGSVVPLFKKQIAEGGPVTITHPDAVRFFMTIQEAVQLILCAGTLAHGGETFVLDMGYPRNILELAREMIMLSGLDPEKDIATTITGLRPGEKLAEELVSSSEKLRSTRFEKLSVIDPQPVDELTLLDDVARLMERARDNDNGGVHEILSSMMGLGFNSPSQQTRAAAASRVSRAL